MDGVDNLVNSQLCFGFIIVFFIYFLDFSGPSMLRLVLGSVRGRGRCGVSGAHLGHVSFVATPEAPAFLHHGSLFFFHEGAIDLAWGIDHHGDCSTFFAMGLSLGFERATPFTFSPSKLCLLLFLWVQAA